MRIRNILRAVDDTIPPIRAFHGATLWFIMINSSSRRASGERAAGSSAMACRAEELWLRSKELWLRSKELWLRSKELWLRSKELRIARHPPPLGRRRLVVTFTHKPRYNTILVHLLTNPIIPETGHKILLWRQVFCSRAFSAQFD